jgi:uncharacterized membrane-anchored protein
MCFASLCDAVSVRALFKIFTAHGPCFSLAPMRALLPVVSLALVAVLSAGAAAAPSDRPKTRAEAEAIVSKLNFEQGSINLHNNLATVTVPSDLRFLNGHDAGLVVTKLWGNPPQADPLGMLVPANADLLRDAWAVIITYEEDGYVKDDDAKNIKYDELLKQMQKDVLDSNAARKQQGYPAFELVGWAATPRYDQPAHKLYWAKNLKFETAAVNTLNYNIRMLGRRGVLVLNAVAGIDQLPDIERATPKILSAVDFNPGNRYVDFSAASGDKVATYGIAALIAGGVAAKVGLFKGVWIAILAAKKFIIIGAAAIGAWIRKLFGKKQTV